jgi:protein gp37
MSDLFHEAVSDLFIARVFTTMALASRHTFQVLTKRPERMLKWFTGGARPNIGVYNAAADILDGDWSRAPGDMASTRSSGGTWWPLPNVWLGVSVEDQRAADERIPLLLDTPAAVRFLSCEPLLGPVRICGGCPGCGSGDCGVLHSGGIGWVIVGGESGPNARPCDVAWIRSIVEQCKAAGVPVFVKQMGGNAASATKADHLGRSREGAPMGSAAIASSPLRMWLDDPKGGDPAEWPDDLRVREFPASAPAQERAE